jgi:mannosyl-glycoproteinendo-beta-N-acetylglucosami dase
MKPKDFIITYKPYALASERKTGISHLFTLAQAALESRWGERAAGHNFFGIKAKSTTPLANKQLWHTSEVLSSPNVKDKFHTVISITPRKDGKYDYKVKDWFMKYSTPEESFTEHGQFFFNNKRYAEALKVKHDPRLFAEAIAKAGYATAPNYAKILKDVILTIEKNS